MTNLISKAARREREAVDELRDASDRIYAASHKFRSDSTATQLSGQLTAAVLIIENVAAKIERRTEEG